ncbi:MAG: hypothetical protein AMXMBFR53_30080 [Gemmatimonadota bacterium]
MSLAYEQTCGDLGHLTVAGKPCGRPAKDGGPCYQHGGAAPTTEVVVQPRDWDKAVSAAYLWLVLDSTEAAAEGAGVGERTMYRWVQSEWWPKACAEANRRWLQHLTLEARRTLIRVVRGGDAQKALEVLQQFDPDFRPRPKEVRVLTVLAFVEQLADDEVRRVMGLPEVERRQELLQLAKQAGVELAV